jgi:hypothetical protein
MLKKKPIPSEKVHNPSVSFSYTVTACALFIHTMRHTPFSAQYDIKSLNNFIVTIIRTVQNYAIQITHLITSIYLLKLTKEH